MVSALWCSGLLSITKLQNLKAIHNGFSYAHHRVCVVINHKITKFESNSQPVIGTRAQLRGCYQSQTTKFESNSQPVWSRPSGGPVVINHKITKFESKLQRFKKSTFFISSCYQSQNYKIWKQFTTLPSSIRIRYWLLSITKLQNLKAIHNPCSCYLITTYVVINHKVTKFESNSQPCIAAILPGCRCYQSQNYKIWKQFTTYHSNPRRCWQLLSITKLQKLKAIHNFFCIKKFLFVLLYNNFYLCTLI